MKNLKPYNKDCFTVHLKAVDKKQINDLKIRLNGLNPEIEKEYKTFEIMFSINSLNTLKPNTVLKNHKIDLLSLYRYQSAVIREVRESIKNQQPRTIITTCQNCTINSVDTLDHILPKSKYPEFIVNPKNLFPCCSTCNSKKLNSLNDYDQTSFLNLYLDQLPDIQYLFLKISYDITNDLNFIFYLKNTNDQIDKKTFSQIQSHFTKLDLFERMKLKSIEYISEFENKISAFKNVLTISKITQCLSESIKEDQNSYGINHWKCVLELALINDPIFLSKI